MRLVTQRVIGGFECEDSVSLESSAATVRPRLVARLLIQVQKAIHGVRCVEGEGS